jgi:hypothetical protein
LAVIATFAGAFTFGTLLTLPSGLCQNQIDATATISSLLAAAFVLFSTALFVMVLVQILLHKADPRRTLVADTYGHFATQGLIAFAAGCLIGGFVLLGVVLMYSGHEGAGQACICLVSIFGGIAGIVGVVGLFIDLVDTVE